MFFENWKSIMFSYSLFSINAILILVYPKIIGDTIDNLILKNYSYIWYLILTFVTLMFFGYVSRIYDTIVFSGIYRKFASVETRKQIEGGVETTKINGRLNLMHHIVRFFEYDMLTIIQTLFGIVVSVYFLSQVSWSIVGFLLIPGVAILMVTYYYSPRIAKLTSMSNDITEEQTKAVSTRDTRIINNLLRRGRTLSIRWSNLDSKFNFCLEFIIYASVSALLTYYIVNNKVTVGSVFSTYRYLFEFCGAMLGMPTIISSIINIKDVIKRLETEN